MVNYDLKHRIVTAFHLLDVFGINPFTTTTLPPTTSALLTTTPVGDLDKSLENILENISPNSTGPDVIDSVYNISAKIAPGGFTENEVRLILNILGNYTNIVSQSNVKFDVDVIKKAVSIASRLTERIDSMDLHLSLLQSIENVFSSMKATDEPVHIINGGIDFSCSVFYPANLSDSSFVEISSGATLYLSTDNMNKSSRSPISILSMIYSPITDHVNVSFSDSNDLSYFLASPIWTIVSIVNNKSDHSLNVHMNFTCNNRTCDDTAQCVFLNFTTNKWSSEGCNTTGNNGSTSCACSHLTSFSILMADSLPQDYKSPLLLDMLTKTLLPISIGSLVNCIAIQVLLIAQTSNSVALYRYICILHIAVFLMISNVTFLASSLFNVTAYGFLCKILTFVIHFSLLAFFSWTLVQGLFLVCRLVFIFHHITKKEFLWLSVILGYACPGSIAVATFLVYYPDRYLKANACWLDSKYGASLFFNIPAMLIMSGNILILLFVISKVLRPSVSEGKSQDDEAIAKLMKAVLFCTPQFGLTWAIGIPLYAYPQATFLHFLFAMLNPLQGLFVLVFGCLLDKKVIETLKEIFKLNSSPNDLTSDTT